MKSNLKIHSGFKKKNNSELYMDDLNYLSEMGEDKIKITEDDIKDLKSNFSNKYLNININFRLVLVSAAALAFVIFLIIFNTNKVKKSDLGPEASVGKNVSFSVVNPKNIKEVETTVSELSIKTSFLKPEKFISVKSKSVTPINNDYLYDGELEYMQPTEISRLSSVNDSSLATIKKSFANIIFIEGLKIANYHKYYFKSKDGGNSLKVGREARYSGVDDENLSKLEVNGDTHEIPVTDILKSGLISFSRGKYKAAENYFSELLDLNKEDENALFYLGMAYYSQGDYEKSLVYLNKMQAIESDAFFEEAEFYSACNLMNLNELSKARSLFQNIVKSSSFYKGRALEHLNKL
ncbi:MAG: tetratricopeptide repeat protein [Bacteroidota bacterium]